MYSLHALRAALLLPWQAIAGALASRGLRKQFEQAGVPLNSAEVELMFDAPGWAQVNAEDMGLDE